MGKKQLLEEFTENNIDSISYCRSCNAYTITINREDYSAHENNFFTYFPGIDENNFKKNIQKVLTNIFSCCNWCVNHWGLDICACGSGESITECQKGFDECGKPMQIIDVYNHVRSGNAWV